jgi:dTDP-4-dehydrorhamnose reductase
LFGRGSGGKGSNFVEAMMRLAAAGDPIRVVSDQICTPSYCLDVANASLELIDRGQFGLYHVTNGGSCSWHEFAVEIFRQLQLKPNLIPVRSHEFGAAAARPKYSVLANEKLVRVGVATPRSWQVALADYLEHRSKNNS